MLQNGKRIRPGVGIMKWRVDEKSLQNYKGPLFFLNLWILCIVGPAVHIGKDLQDSWKIPFIIQLETQLTPVGFGLPHKCEQFLLRAVK